MPPSKSKPILDFTIIGAGTLAAALANALRHSGYALSEIVSRNHQQSLSRARRLAKQVGARATTLSAARLAAKVIWICVPDDAISGLATQLAAIGRWRGKIVMHSSGALDSGALAPLRRAGAAVASAHPLMTFVSAVQAGLGGVPFAMEGDRKALAVVGAVVRSFAGKPFPIPAEQKPAYHLFGFFSSPALVALVAAAQRAGTLAGLSQSRAGELMEPIVRQTIDNCFRRTPQKAFSGPLRRGDVATIRKHLEVLQQQPEMLALYRALSRIALEQLPVGNRDEMGKLLG